MEHAANAHAYLIRLIRRHAVSPAQATFLLHQLESDHALGPVNSWCTRLPALTYEAAGGVGAVPTALLGGCLAIYLGADLLDEVADRELPPVWSAAGPDQATLTSFAMMYPIAIAAFRELEIEPERQLALLDALHPALLEMVAGQSVDLATEHDDDMTRARCEEIASHKAAQSGFYARAGAITAGAPARVAQQLETVGCAIGICGQFLSDCAELLAPIGDSKDLRRGKRTLPVTHALATLTGDDRARLRANLTAAPTDPEREQAAREAIIAAGSMVYTAIVAETHRQRAMRALRELEPTRSSGLVAFVTELAPLRHHRGEHA